MSTLVYIFDQAGAQLGTDTFDVVPAFPSRAGDLSVTLVQAVMISLLTRRRARKDDDLPDTTADPVDRGGWWADAYAEDGDQIGSRLWLLERSLVVSETINQAREYAEEALSWMVADGLASKVTVVAARVGRDILGMEIQIERDDGHGLTLKFADLWSALDG